MAYVRRLIICVLIFLPAGSFADTVYYDIVWTYTRSSVVYAPFSGSDSACQDFISKFAASYSFDSVGSVLGLPPAGYSVCYGKTSSTSGVSLVNVNQSCGYPPAGVAAAGYSVSLGRCVGVAPACAAGYQRVGTSCVADLDNCASKAGSAWIAPSAGGAWKTTRSGYSFCPQTGGTTTCVAVGSSIGSDGAGNNYIYGPWSYTGGLCSTAGLGSGESPSPVQCKAGQCPGTVNGVSVCVACSSMTEKKTATSAQAASSVASGATTATTSSSGSSSTSETTCTNGTCSTTTTSTTTNSDGSTGQSKTTDTKSQGDYCKDNPNASVCKSDSQWGGSCSVGFSCDADAVQCAQAQASWKSACATDISATDPLVTAGQSAMNGTLPNSDPKAGDTGGGTDISSSFDTTERYTGSCPSDMTVDVLGRSVAVPISRACPYFSAISYVAVAMSLLVGARIAFGGGK
jgi:hypothetical protein